MSAPAAAAAPVQNYYHPEPFSVPNPATGQMESRYVQDWRFGWKKEGKLGGDQLPIIVIPHPDGRHFALLRPYHLLNGDQTVMKEGKPVVVFTDPRLPKTFPPNMGHWKAVEIFKNAFGPKNQ